MKFLISLFLVCSVVCAHAQSKDAFKKENFVFRNDTLPLRVLYPPGFDPHKKYPLVLFLHGRGEAGKDNERQLTHRSKLFLDSISKYPAIVVFPQCPVDSYWANVKISADESGKRHFNFQKGGKPTKAMSLLKKFFDSSMRKKFIVDNRIYVMGLSMGGMGTYELLRRRPNKVAAAVAICGGDNVKNVPKYANKVDLWIIHGERDDVVPPTFSKNIVTKLHDLGSNIKSNFYKEANHNSWDRAFSEKELLKWLFSKRR